MIMKNKKQEINELAPQEVKDVKGYENEYSKEINEKNSSLYNDSVTAEKLSLFIA